MVQVRAKMLKYSEHLFQHFFISSFSVNIIVASRLVYRKGIDLLANIIPRFKSMRHIKFTIIGDGIKRELLEEIRDKADMQNSVEIVGAVEHSKVREFLTKGHIFLNTSLTEAYCMAIVEAASCGLQVVSTSVGGIPEVLPDSLIILTEPESDSIYKGVLEAIKRLQIYQQKYMSCEQHLNNSNNTTTSHIENIAKNIKTDEYALTIKNKNKVQKCSEISSYRNFDETQAILCPYKCNEVVSSLYNWGNVTQRTESIYKNVVIGPNRSFGQILYSYLKANVWSMILIISLLHIILLILEYIYPKHDMEKAKDQPNLKKKK